MAWYLNGYQVNDDMIFREVFWLYTKLSEKVKEQNNNANSGINSLNNMML